MGAPEIIYLVLIAIGLLQAAHMHGKPKEENWNFWLTLFSSAIVLGLLLWGGFFK